MEDIHPEPVAPKGRGRGTICRSDKSQAKKLLKQQQQQPALPVMATRPVSPDSYHSAREPSDFEYESDDPPELDPGPTDSEYEDDEGAAFSGYSSAGSAAQG